MLVLAVMLGALLFAPAAFAQDDNPTGDDLGGDDRNGGVRGFDENPTGDDAAVSPTATASSTASATPTSSATPTATGSPGAGTTTALPNTGGTPMRSSPAAAAGVLSIGSGIAAALLPRRPTP